MFIRKRCGNIFAIGLLLAYSAAAYVLFERGQNDRVVGISMTKLDPGDFDFEDLNLSRVE